MSTTAWLAVTPRDTVFIRDGRAFDAAANATAQTVWPSPTTIAGAVGAAYGAWPAEVRGPVLARQAGHEWEPYFPVPADLVRTSDEIPYVFRLERAEPGGQTDLGPGQDGGPQCWLTPPPAAEPAEPLDGWIPAVTLSRYLSGELPGPDGCELAELGVVYEPMPTERRVGLARDSGHRARSGFFYQSAHLRPAEGWAFLAECVLRPDWTLKADGVVTFGGRGRLADVAPAQARWPKAAEGSARGRVLVYLATAAIWPGGWRIPLPPGADLVAAAVGEPVPAATVTPADRDWRSTRKLRWAVPAGSVYLLEFEDPVDGARWARRVNGTAHGPASREELRTAGFGVVLTGAWT